MAEIYINRLKEKVQTVDFPLIIQELAEEGYTNKHISEIIGCSNVTISQIKNDTLKGAAGWNEAVMLIDMYLRVTHKETLPFI